MNILTIIAASTFLFCLAVAFDITPYLRGPAPYPPEWRWDYLYINTWNKAYLPLLVTFVFIGLFLWVERAKKYSSQKLWLLLFTLIILLVFYHLSVLFFSRSGIGVLLHRIINPEINGYFTTAVTIDSVPMFLKHFSSLLPGYVFHVQTHPPGGILLFYYVNELLSLVPVVTSFIAQFNPTHTDVRAVWQTLTVSEKATAVVSPFFMLLLSAVSIIPLYFSSKLLFGEKVAVRSIFLVVFLPSLLFFIPINDAILHLFSVSAFCLFIYGLKRNSLLQLFFSGVVLFLGVFISLSVLPLLLLFFIYFVLFYGQQFFKRFATVLKNGIVFCIGFFITPVLLFFFFQFNFIEVIQTIFTYVPHVYTRSYSLWLFFNLLDFFIFAGIAVTILYFTAIITFFKKNVRKKWKSEQILLIAFTITLVIVNLTGSTRGETSRIWIPYLPFLILIVSAFTVSPLKFSTKIFSVVLLLQALQILVMQEFWVMLW